MTEKLAILNISDFRILNVRKVNPVIFSDHIKKARSIERALYKIFINKYPL